MPIQKGQKQARGLRRRQEILEAALKAFAAEGYHATTLAKVAASLGITEAGVLHHFTSKEALLAEVVRWRDHVDPGTIQEVPKDNIIDSIRSLGSLARILLSAPELMRFDAVIGGESIARGGPPFDYFQTRMRHARAALADHLSSARRSGAIRSDVDARAVAAEIIAFMHGIQTQWLYEPEGIDLEKSYRHFFEHLADNLAP